MRHFVSGGLLKWHQTHVYEQSGGLVMSAQGPSIAQVSSCYRWSPGVGATGMLENMSVALEHIDASLQESGIVLKRQEKSVFQELGTSKS